MSGWNAVLATALEKVDNYVHTYLRYKVSSGEEIAAYDPVCLTNLQWQKACADGVKQPSFGLAIESGVSGEYLRAQTVGPLTNPDWTFSGSGEVYLSTSGTLVQTIPETNVEIVGKAISPTTILLWPPGETTVINNTGSGSYSFQTINIGSGEVSFNVDTTEVGVAALTADAAVSITDISGCNAGAIKVLAFDDGNITLVHNGAKIILQGAVNANFASGDILVLLNRGGNQPSTNGYWREIWRSLYS
jgi:hypothetical protein